MRLLEKAVTLVSCTALLACARGTRSHPMPSSPTACASILIWRLPDGNFIETTAWDRRSSDEVMTHARMDGIALSAAYRCLSIGRLAESYTTMVLPSDALSKVNEECVFDPEFVEDAWGTEIEYSVIEDSFQIRSAGPDRVFDTSDDIRMPNASDAFAWKVEVRQKCESPETPSGDR